MAESSLRTLYQCLSDITNAESCFVRRDDVVVNNGCEVQCDVILSHTHLTWYLNDLNLDVDLDEALRKRVYLYKTWINCARKLSELCDESDVSLRDWLVRIGADDAAGNCAEEANSRTKGIYCTGMSAGKF